jgi:hypothetical protein
LENVKRPKKGGDFMKFPGLRKKKNCIEEGFCFDEVQEIL